MSGHPSKRAGGFALAVLIAASAHATPAPVTQAETAAAGASAAEPDAIRGQKAFRRYCAVCHGMRAEGGVGPSLQGVGKRLTQQQITDQIVEPRGSMPRLYPSPMSDEMLSDVTAYLLRLP